MSEEQRDQAWQQSLKQMDEAFPNLREWASDLSEHHWYGRKGWLIDIFRACFDSGWKAANEQAEARATELERKLLQLSKFVQWIQDYPAGETDAGLRKVFKLSLNRQCAAALKGVPVGDIAWAREVLQERARAKQANERDAATAQAGQLRAALVQWKCPVCGGAGHCTTCGITGLHPVARAALALTPTEAMQRREAERRVVEAARRLVGESMLSPGWATRHHELADAVDGLAALEGEAQA